MYIIIFQYFQTHNKYVLRKNRKKRGKSTKGLPGIGLNLTEKW
jgi:hypothetical protein